jgi:hypothetical protein
MFVFFLFYAGHPLTYGVIIRGGEFDENTSLCDNDSVTMEGLLNDQNIFAIKYVKVMSILSKCMSNSEERY